MAATANQKRTPPIMTTGIFTCRSPFDTKISIDTVYTVEAIRTFPELERQKINVLKDIYLANGLSEEQYRADSAAKASAIVLTSDTQAPVRVPNTYIESYPSMAGIAYNRNVIIVDVGIVPASIDLNLLKKDLEDVVTKQVGVTKTTYIDTMPYEGDVTYDQHIALERARKAAISSHVPLELQLADAFKTIESLKKSNDELIEIVKQTQS